MTEAPFLGDFFGIMPDDRKDAPAHGILTTRQWVGLGVAPFAFAWFMWGWAPSGVTTEMRQVAALTALMAVLWIFESVPLAATALLPLVMLPLCSQATAGQVSASYANDLIFLFIGGFVLANGIEHWGLHRRIAGFVLLQLHHDGPNLSYDVPIFGAQCCPRFAAHCEDQRIDRVVPESDIAMHGPEFVGDDQRDRILLTVYFAELKRDQRLVEVHTHRISAERPQGFRNYWYRRNPNSQAMEIVRPADRTL